MKHILQFLVCLFLTFIAFISVDAATIGYDGNGSSLGSSEGGGGGATRSDYTLQFSNMLKVSLIKLNGDTDFEEVDSYVLINRVRSTNETFFGQEPVRSNFNLYAKVFKGGTVYNSGGPNYSADVPCSYYDIDGNTNRFKLERLSCTSSVAYSQDLGYFQEHGQTYYLMNEDVIEFETGCSGSCYQHLWFARHDISGANIDINHFKAKLQANNNELFYKIAYPVMNKNLTTNQYKIPEIQVSSPEELKTLLNSQDYETTSVLRNYRLLIQPLYIFKHKVNYKVRFATIKAMARASKYNSELIGGYYFVGSGLANNFNSVNKHGVINSPGHKAELSINSGNDKFSGIGYMVITIVNDEVSNCNKATQCCYDAGGNYHHEYYTSNTNYKCVGNSDATCRGELVSCNPVQECPDTITRAKCGTAAGTVAVFHENDNLKDCALNDNSQSGFDLISNNDTYVTIGGTRKSYCKVSCKDDFDIMYPTNRSGFAGQYFTLENYIPTVKIKRTCVTTELDYDGFKRDLNQLESLITSSTGANKTRYFNTYNDAIAKYKKCTEWIDDDSINMNNLKMKFSYDNDIYNLFGSGTELKKKSKDYTKDTKYWQGDLVPDNKYTNANSNKLVETIQVFNTAAGDEVNITFTKNTYIKRTEEKTYTFTTPTLYSLIPSGRIVINKPSGSYETLVDNAIPIGLSVKKGKYNYKIVISGIKSLNRNSGADSLEYRFTEAVMSEYKCTYEVDNDLYNPPEACVGLECDSGLNFFYRPVDMSLINPNNRELGYNWKDYNEKEIKNTCNSKECKANESMKASMENYQVLVNGDKDKFEFVLTPGIMSDIRNYNVKETHNGGYSDWKMNCIEGGLYYYCKSNILTCLASSGNENEGSGFDACSSIFTSNNIHNLNPTYDSSELLKNRNILMKKLEGFK